MINRMGSDRFAPSISAPWKPPESWLTRSEKAHFKAWSQWLWWISVSVL